MRHTQETEAGHFGQTAMWLGLGMRLCVLVLLLGSMVTSVPAVAGPFRAIKSELEFRRLVVDRMLRHADTYIIHRDSGGMATADPQTIELGRWEWRGYYMCRTMTDWRKGVDCQTWETDGEVFRVTPHRGTGQRMIYAQLGAAP